MHPLLRSVFTAVVVATLIPGVAAAQISLEETGYTVTDLGSSTGAKGVECSPGGIWGDYVYIGDSVGDLVERIDFADNLSLFATLDPNAFPVGMEFGPGPATDFGDYLYICNYGLSRIDKITPTGVVSPFTNIAGPSDAAFDPTGVYGTEMFVASAYSGPIWKVDDLGNAVSFSPVQALYIKFGPGGAWGTGLYSTSQTAVGIVTVDMAGVAADFCTGFTSPEGFDWAYGTGFDGDMFATDVTTGEVWRVMSDGTRVLWATMPSAADVTFCDGSLYLVGFHTGDCFKITPEDPVAVTFTDVQAIAADEAVELRWDVFADEDILGFIAYREDAGEPGSERSRVSGLLLDHERAFTDETVVPGGTYRYTIGALMPDGREIMSSPATVSVARVSLMMAQNFPNPFNPTTTIEYALPETAPVTLGIYDGKGRLVVELDAGARPAGTHQVTWDGRNGLGESVASGVYFYRLTVGKRILTRKLVLLK